MLYQEILTSKTPKTEIIGLIFCVFLFLKCSIIDI